MTLSAQARGVYAIAPTPFTPAGEVDHESLARLCRFYQRAGVTGALVCGHLTDHVREFVAEYLCHVRHRWSWVWLGRYSPPRHDPVRQALLHQILELLTLQDPMLAPVFTDQLFRSGNFPIGQPLLFFESHVPSRRLDGQGIGGNSIGVDGLMA